MPVIHKVMFIAGIVMFVLSSCHLGLVIQQVTVPDVPLKNAQAQVSIATIQVSVLSWLHKHETQAVRYSVVLNW